MDLVLIRINQQEKLRLNSNLHRFIESSRLSLVLMHKNLPKSCTSSEEFHSLYRSPNKVGVIKSRRLRWAGHEARIE